MPADRRAPGQAEGLDHRAAAQTEAPAGGTPTPALNSAPAQTALSIAGPAAMAGAAPSQPAEAAQAEPAGVAPAAASAVPAPPPAPPRQMTSEDRQHLMMLLILRGSSRNPLGALR